MKQRELDSSFSMVRRGLCSINACEKREDLKQGRMDAHRTS